MFNASSSSLLRKRDGILGQFSKAVNGLIKVNEEIDVGVDNCNKNIISLKEKSNREFSEKDDLLGIKSANEKTIEKMREFLV